jgi:hypothetical protein
VRLYHDGLVLRHELGDEAGLAEVLEGLACVDSADGRDRDAATLIAAATALRQRTGSVVSQRDVGAVDRALATSRERIGEDDVAESFQRTQQLSVAEIVELALGSCREASAASESSD